MSKPIVWKENPDEDWVEADRHIKGVWLTLAVAKTKTHWTWAIYNNDHPHDRGGSLIAAHGACPRMREAKAAAILWSNKLYS